MRLVQWSTQLGSIHTVDTSLAEHGKFMGGGQAAHRSSEDRPLRIRREEVRLTPVESGFYGTGKEKSQQKVLSSATKLLEYPAPPINPPLSRSKRTRERGEGERKRFVREEDLAVRSQKMETKRKERLGLDGGSVYKLRLKSDVRNVRCSAEIKSGRETGQVPSSSM